MFVKLAYYRHPGLLALRKFHKSGMPTQELGIETNTSVRPLGLRVTPTRWNDSLSDANPCIHETAN
jgi:hypothetical protein